MAYNYKVPLRDQLFLLPPSIADWLPEEHMVWFVLDVVAMVDLSAFHARHPNDGAGRAAYDPEMMLALLLYAYCRGLRSSRRIEAACRSDLAFRAICAELVPDHIAVARFRADHQTAIRGVFIDVLELCAKAGLASLGTIAIDGTKIASDAALDVNRTESAIAAEVDRILAQAGTADEADAVAPSLGSELPAELARPGSRLARLRAALGEIEAERAAREKAEAERSQRLADDAAAGKRPRGAAPVEPVQALARAQADVTALTVRKDKAATTLAKLEATSTLGKATKRLRAAEKAAAKAPDSPEPQANTTDPQSRIMKTATGWVQGFNAQAAVNANQVVLACAVTRDHNDVGQLVPMMAAVAANAAAAGIEGGLGTVLADAGYWSEANATAPGPDRLIATSKDWKQRRAAREMGTTTGPAPDGASTLEAMEHRLRTEEGAAAYGQRSCTVEPVFGQAKENRGVRRFMRRGLAAAESEWALVCATGNILKLFGHAGGGSLAATISPAR
ncbi:MAG: transposase [Geodermatophilaceae bacterium]